MTTSYSDVVNWMAESLWRPFGMLSALAFYLIQMLAVAERYSWRMGYAEPGSRMHWASANAVADMTFFVVLVGSVFALHGAYRWYASGPDAGLDWEGEGP